MQAVMRSCPKCGREFNALMVGLGAAREILVTPCCGKIGEHQDSAGALAQRTEHEEAHA